DHLHKNPRDAHLVLKGSTRRPVGGLRFTPRPLPCPVIFRPEGRCDQRAVGSRGPGLAFTVEWPLGTRGHRVEAPGTGGLSGRLASFVSSEGGAYEEALLFLAILDPARPALPRRRRTRGRARLVHRNPPARPGDGVPRLRPRPLRRVGGRAADTVVERGTG